MPSISAEMNMNNGRKTILRIFHNLDTWTEYHPGMVFWQGQVDIVDLEQLAGGNNRKGDAETVELVS